MTAIAVGNLPLWSPEGPLIHVGTMNTADKGSDSYEGHGLSVSECPDEWVEIAKLGGLPFWAMERMTGEPRFLDLYEIDNPTRRQIMAWAVEQGLCEPCRTFEVHYTDTEIDRPITMVFDCEANAREEYEARLEYEGLEEVNDHEPAHFSELAGHRLTALGLETVNRREAGPAESETLAIAVWTERCTDLDGVYWDSELNVGALSAPCAVILPSKLNEWSREITHRPQMKTAGAARERSGA